MNFSDSPFNFDESSKSMFKRTLQTSKTSEALKWCTINTKKPQSTSPTPSKKSHLPQDCTPAANGKENTYTPVAKPTVTRSHHINTVFRNVRQEAYNDIKASQKDLYASLGVSSVANQKDVNKAYKKLCLKYHPDKSKGFEKEFNDISEAHTILSRPELRQIYDEHGYDTAIMFLKIDTSKPL